MYEVFLSDEAKDNLRNINNYIAQDNSSAGKVFIYDLFNFLEKNLSTFPLWFSSHNNVYRIPYRHYVAFYEVNKIDKRVEVVLIVSSFQFNEYKEYWFSAKF